MCCLPFFCFRATRFLPVNVPAEPIALHVRTVAAVRIVPKMAAAAVFVMIVIVPKRRKNRRGQQILPIKVLPQHTLNRQTTHLQAADQQQKRRKPKARMEEETKMQPMLIIPAPLPPNPTVALQVGCMWPSLLG